MLAVARLVDPLPASIVELLECWVVDSLTEVACVVELGGTGVVDTEMEY